MSSLPELEFRATAEVAISGGGHHRFSILQRLTQFFIVCLCICNWFEITIVSEKHMVEDDVLFTNHLAGK